MKNRPSTTVFFALFLGVALIFTSPLAHALGIPQPVSDEIAREFVEKNPGSGLVIIQDFRGYDLHYEPGHDGLFGKMVFMKDYILTDRQNLENETAVFTIDRPTMRLKKVEVLVISQGEETRYREKDLRWYEWTAQRNGVVTLDGQVSRAFIPGLKAGDRVRVSDEYQIKGSFGLGTVDFGSEDTPTRETLLEIHLPRDHQLLWGVQGPAEDQEKFHYSLAETGRWDVHRWSLKPGQKETLPVCNDRFPALNLTLQLTAAGTDGDTGMVVGDDWSTVGAAYGRKIEDKFEASSEMVTLARNLVAEAETPLEKIDLIYTEVQRRCRYLGLFEGTGAMIPVPADEVFELGFGDCKGLATLLISLLRAVDVAAYPVLVLADNQQTVNPEIPCITQFNHFIAWADDGDGGVFLDGTVDHYRAGQVPDLDCKSEVLFIRPGDVRLVNIPKTSSPPGAVTMNLEGHLIEGGYLTCNLKYETTGTRAIDWRAWLAESSTAELNEKVRAQLEPDHHPMTFEMIQITGLEDRGGPLVVELQAQSKAPIPKTEDEMFLPFALWDMTPATRKKPPCGGRSDLWRSPVRIDSWSCQLPPGFRLAQADSLVQEEGQLRWSYRCWQEGSLLRMEQSFEYLTETADAEEIKAQNELIREIRKKGRGYLQLVRQ